MSQGNSKPRLTPLYNAVLLYVYDIKETIKMDNNKIDKFILKLDQIVTNQELCVYPDKQTLDCCDCYLCHVDFYNKIRDELKNKG